ncbi:MAG: PAS domain S-box protein, partial [Chloroflexi bacterium]|nr:PAS domain S-box protein [Chloroflexota bacterium]
MYDITERREAEEHIRRLSRIVEQSPASIVITNRLGYIEYANPAFSELTGYSLEEAKDKTPRILKSGYTSESEYKKLWNVITSGHIWRGEFLNKKKNGETYWESAIIAPVFNDAGKIINFVGVKQDITERKRAEEERESARRFLQNVQDSLAAHIAILDGLGNIVQVNAAWKEFGRKNGLTHPDACVGMNYLEVCDKAAQTGEEGAAEAAAAIRQALNGERESAWFEYPCHAPNEKRWYTARISSFYNHGQRWAVVSHENITARKQAEESLRARAAELELLYESGLTLAQSLDQRQICRRLIKLLSEKLNWHHTAIRLLNSEEQTFELVAFDLPNKGKSPQGETTLLKNLRLDEGLSGWAFQQARPIRVGDVSQDPHYIESYPGIRSGLYVPLKLGDRSLGVISVESETLNAFSEADERFIVTAANQAAALLENARLYKEVRSQAKELEKRVRERTAEIESTRRRLELALKTAGIGIWEWDVSSEVESWDDKVFELHGLDKEKDQPSHAAWRKTVHPDDLPLQMERIEKALLGKRPYNSEYRVILPGGAIRHLKVNGIVIRDKEGKPQRVIGADQDITLHKQAEESLLRANAEMQRSLRMKTEFLATMSHELRTPLNSILGISESLEEQIAGPLNEKQLKYIRTVSESGRHLLELINDILDLSRIEAGKLDLDIQSVSVQKVCAASLRMIKELAQKKSLNVSFKMDENAQTVRGDERRLKQILVNLLGNAVKFTPEGGDIGLEVKTNLQAHEILFTVWDKGIGIAEEDRERLFQPFVQLKSGLAREYGGSGLGLALVMQMTHLHGGKVSVESKVNEGSRFTVALPWEAEEKAKNL